MPKIVVTHNFKQNLFADPSPKPSNETDSPPLSLCEKRQKRILDMTSPFLNSKDKSRNLLKLPVLGLKETSSGSIQKFIRSYNETLAPEKYSALSNFSLASREVSENVLEVLADIAQKKVLSSTSFVSKENKLKENHESLEKKHQMLMTQIKTVIDHKLDEKRRIFEQHPPSYQALKQSFFLNCEDHEDVKPLKLSANLKELFMLERYKKYKKNWEKYTILKRPPKTKVTQEETGRMDCSFAS